MSESLPKIIKKTSFFSGRARYGLYSTDGNEILKIKYDDYAPYDGQYFYFHDTHDGWLCFDRNVSQLVPYRFRDGASKDPISASNTLVHCYGFLNRPVFRGGYAAVQFRGTELWHIITANGRILFSTGKNEPTVLGNGFFSVTEDDVLSILDLQGRALMRFPNPCFIADLIPMNGYFPLLLKDGQWQYGEYKVNGGMVSLTHYISRFSEEACGMYYTGTHSFSTDNSAGTLIRRMTLSFAPVPSMQDSLSLNIEAEGNGLFFTICAPAAPDAVYPVPYEQDESISLCLQNRLSDLRIIQSRYLDDDLCPADAKIEDYRKPEENIPDEVHGDFDDYPYDTTRV